MWRIVIAKPLARQMIFICSIFVSIKCIGNEENKWFRREGTKISNVLLDTIWFRYIGNFDSFHSLLPCYIPTTRDIFLLETNWLQSCNHAFCDFGPSETCFESILECQNTSLRLRDYVNMESKFPGVRETKFSAVRESKSMTWLWGYPSAMQSEIPKFVVELI